MDVRVAELDDLDAVAETMTAAFASDPLWGWAFPEAGAMRSWWRFCIASAMRYPWVWIADDCAAASVWIPQGGVELTEDEEARVEGLVSDLVGARKIEVMDLLERFDRNHPRDREHYYLSLLGTHPDRRGKGLGIALLAENLELIDGEGASAYLESSNPANDPKYERNGFRRVGSFDRPDGGTTVSTMWREPAAAA
jgi:GNAT superfamily N-acetyltransferase